MAQAQSAALHLIPMPREVRVTGTQALAQGVRIACTSCFTDAEDSFTAQDLTASLGARGISAQGTFAVTLVRTQALPPEMQAEGYTIAPTAGGVTLSAASGAGLFYAVQTFQQMIEGDGAAAVLRLATVRDWPAMKYRGMQDDVSRGPVPTLAFQEQLVRTLAEYKVNVYSPYFEHTQQYGSNPLFAPPGGAISAADARALVAFAARYHVTVIPEQEAFGHLHHNLTWEQYQPLAETPHGAVLAPGQAGSLALIDQMFGELAKLYPSPLLHIGADETVDLGLGQTKPDVDARTLGPVYLDFLQKIVASLAPLGRRYLFWGDVAQTIQPELLNALPKTFKQSTIAVAWWYAPRAKGYASFLTPFTQAGFETWVAPGISNWSSIYPNYNDALSNIQQFVLEGQRQHSTGVLNTTWYDDGEALASNNWYGLLFGAAASWQPGESSIDGFEHSYGEVFHGDATGALDQAQLAMMQAHAILRNQAHVGDGSDGLFWLDPWSVDGQTVAGKIRPFVRDVRLAAERALTLIAQARAAYPAPAGGGVALNEPLPSNPTTLRHPEAIDALELGARRLDLVGLKFELCDEIKQGYARGLVAQASPDKKLHATVDKELSDIRGINGRLEDIRDTYALLRDLYEQMWLQTNRAYALRPVLEHYDATVQLWQARSDRFRSVQKQYGATKTLPSAADLGLPR